jgi:hypothetical protein
MTSMRSWFEDNSTLVYFLAAQAVAIGGLVASLIAYSTRLESRVSTLEVRGSPHLTVIDNRLTVLEKQTEANKERIERVVDVMTRKLNINP